MNALRAALSKEISRQNAGSTSVPQKVSRASTTIADQSPDLAKHRREMEKAARTSVTGLERWNALNATGRNAALGVRVTPQLRDDLKVYAKEAGLPMAEIVERAIRAAIDRGLDVVEGEDD